ncbi:MAG: FAD-binding oxidoreductase, partial [Oceanisphaera sp.]|nr:FAD-binding oxidoreductase [Oceanisphaera sp.]
MEHVNSYYAASANQHAAWPQLTDDIRCDVCVVGGGYTGLSTALFLVEAGFDVVVLEASRIGFGASGRNGGQIVNSYSRDIGVIESRYGQDTARMLGSMMFEGGDIIRSRIEQYQIDCDFRPGGIFAALNKRQLEELKSQKSDWERYGHQNLELLDAGQVREEIDTQAYVGALLDHRGGHIHPLNLALGEAEAIRKLGGRIFEQSAAVDIQHGDPATVVTARGRVEANFVVMAGNAYLGNLVPKLAAKAMPCGSQVITTEPLSEAQASRLIPNNYCVEDCNYLLDYFR